MHVAPVVTMVQEISILANKVLLSWRKYTYIHSVIAHESMS